MAATKTNSNKNLHNASKAKKDEFYTQLEDISNELRHYKDQFKGKVVFCNCDDPKESNFVKYFSQNFEHLGLKKLIATHYKGATLFTNEPPYKLEYTGDKNNNRMPDPSEFVTKMIGDGDFRSEECIELLKEADIVVTNPPFSLFREYVAQLVEYNKKFLIIGNMNAISYKEVFKLIKENKLWAGYGFNMSLVYRSFYKNALEANRKFVIGKGYNPDTHIKVPAINWFTNLDIKKRYEKLILYKKYSPEEYPKYDNYNAINIDKVADIPMDYNGVMGVPITFLDKYNPEQFEIIWIADRQNSEGLRTKTYTVKDAKNYNDLNRGPVIKVNGELKVVYMRILIKKKK